MKNLLYQARQFTKPFPEPGSWSYNFQAWMYDRTVGHVTGDINTEPVEEPGNNGSSGENRPIGSNCDGSAGTNGAGLSDDRGAESR